MPPFVPGRELNRRYYREAILPILQTQFPRVKYSAGLIGSGSEVLGYDTELSSDHDWGPRGQIFLRKADGERYRGRIDKALRERLPPNFRGYSTSFLGPEEFNPAKVRDPHPGTEIQHNIWIGTAEGFFREYLGYSPGRKLTVEQWLATPQQKLLTLSEGIIFHDGIGLRRELSKFGYYPRDVWLHLLSSQWLRISEEEAFVGRTADVNDELGSRLIAARQVRELMLLCFLLERQYAPYDKWLGSAFLRLSVGGELRPLLIRVLEARTTRARERVLSQAYERIAVLQNSLRLTDPLPSKVSSYHNRPYQVIHSGDFARGLRSRIRDADLRRMNRIGSVDQFSDFEELSGQPQNAKELQRLIRRIQGSADS